MTQTGRNQLALLRQTAIEDTWIADFPNGEKVYSHNGNTLNMLIRKEYLTVDKTDTNHGAVFTFYRPSKKGRALI